MIYITSDHHFGHKKIIEYEDRPFDSCGDMNRALIDNWNRVVCKDDFVIHLGDFSMMCPDMTRDLCRELAGQIIMINGNHDHRTRTYWEQRACILKWFKRPQYFDGIWLTHRVDWRYIRQNDYSLPPVIWTGKLHYEEVKDEDIVLHGHSHSKEKRFLNFIDCGVDAWDFCPVALPVIIGPLAVQLITKWIETKCL
jgi:calcineurin-like phosphoesterase family protein